MAHSCPDCGCLCHCGGDIDDIDFGDDSEDAMNCHHYQQPECAGYDEEIDGDLPCGCDHVDVSCDAPDCPLHATPSTTARHNGDKSDG
jgi:hypothetical protein